MNLLLNLSQSFFDVAIKLIFSNSFEGDKLVKSLTMAKNMIFWLLFSNYESFVLMLNRFFHVDFHEDSKFFGALVPQMLFLAFGTVIKHFLIIFADVDAVGE